MKLSANESHGISVRLALPADDAVVGDLLVDAFESAYARKLPEVVYDDERRNALRAVAEKRAVASVWVAELDGRVVGTVALFPPGAPGSEAWLPNAADLRHLAIHPALHGKGLSSALLDTAEETARTPAAPERGPRRLRAEAPAALGRPTRCAPPGSAEEECQATLRPL